MSNECPCAECQYHYGCEEIKAGGGFPYWGCLTRYLTNDCKPVWLRHALIRAAKKWMPDTTFFGNGPLSITNAPYGGYTWFFVIKMRQEQLWNYREFQEGYTEGCSAKKPERGDNPYTEPSRKSSWDKGYIWGLYKREKKNELNK